MKFKILVLSLSIAMIGCSQVPKKEGLDPGPVTTINSQKLASSFQRQNIKVEYDCVWGTGLFDTTCIKTSVKSIEVTGYANSFGNSEVLREQAFRVAHDVALDKLVRFVQQDINSTRVVTTMAKNIEKAQDRIKNKIKSDEEVAMSEEDASKDTNFAIRENTNNVVRQIAETIRTNSQGIVRGARIIDEKIVDRQTVGVTLRWDTDSERASNYLRKKFIK